LRRDANEPPFDGVRAAFLEGPSLYEGSGFRRRNHIQLAIRIPTAPRDTAGSPNSE